MNRRLLVLATALTLTAGLGGSALASGIGEGSEATRGLCVGLSQSHNGPVDGVCVWIPGAAAAP